MIDPRVRLLADVLCHHSLRLKPGESVLLEAFDVPDEVVAAMVDVLCGAGVYPLVALRSAVVQHKLLQHAGEGLMSLTGAVDSHRMGAVDAYIGLRGALNITENADIPAERMRLYTHHVYRPVHLELRVPRGRWVVLRWPNSSMAQLAGMSTEAFEDFYFSVCCFDYAKLEAAMKPLVSLLEATDEVRLTGPGTDLSFSVLGIPKILCAGEYNIPDGEVFTAPVRESINGTIRFNAPAVYHGVNFDDIELTFRDGRVEQATSSNTARLNEILDTDEGARYTGEFAIGVHPRITEPMRDALFDEKIAGSIHLTPGNAYDEADNGNRSEVHWDMVLLQDAAHGGGEMWFDGRLVRRDGIFVVPELAGLNPERLLG